MRFMKYTEVDQMLAAFLHEIQIKEIIDLANDIHIRVNRHAADTLGELAAFGK